MGSRWWWVLGVAILLLIGIASLVVRWQRNPPVTDPSPAAIPVLPPAEVAQPIPEPSRQPVPGMPAHALPVAPPPVAALGAQARFLSPAPGAVVTSPVKLRMAVSGLRLEGAGIVTPGTGHFHVFVNQQLPTTSGPLTLRPGMFEFGAGETDGELELPPGEHRLQILMGDGNHVPHDPPVVSDVLRISVR
jgi:hypothetical protein